jgi:hypothetical protein
MHRRKAVKTQSAQCSTHGSVHYKGVLPCHQAARIRLQETVHLERTTVFLLEHVTTSALNTTSNCDMNNPVSHVDPMRCDAYRTFIHPLWSACREEQICSQHLGTLVKPTQSLLQCEANFGILCHFDERETFSISRRPASMGSRRLHRGCYNEADADTKELAHQRYGGSTRTTCRETQQRV